MVNHATRRPIIANGIHRRKDGYSFPVEVRLTLIPNTHSDNKLFLAISRDITKRKEQEQNLIDAMIVAEEANK